jgi:hypothetical protein
VDKIRDKIGFLGGEKETLDVKRNFRQIENKLDFSNFVEDRKF